MRRQARGFTLIELMLVLMILGVVSAVVALRIQAPMREARMRDVTGQIAGFDRLTRLQATEHDRPAQMVVDMEKGELRRTDSKGEEMLGTPLELPPDFAVEKVLVAGEDAAERTAAVKFSRLGLTRSYAVLLVGPGGRSRWLLFTGLAGELVPCESEGEVRAVLEKALPGDDAR